MWRDVLDGRGWKLKLIRERSLAANPMRVARKEKRYVVYVRTDTNARVKWAIASRNVQNARRAGRHSRAQRPRGR